MSTPSTVPYLLLLTSTMAVSVYRAATKAPSTLEALLKLSPMITIILYMRATRSNNSAHGKRSSSGLLELLGIPYSNTVKYGNKISHVTVSQNQMLNQLVVFTARGLMVSMVGQIFLVRFIAIAYDMLHMFLFISQKLDRFFLFFSF